ncbi:ABC transporter permease [Actinomadura kijaniata]|uniref:ABC transporter permease n=1 Tax=Actinomadura kijaniata TaxID=46161 RepID=UPI00082EBDA3|nr:ABC transporter permease [Actinomadura kijaniata]
MRLRSADMARLGAAGLRARPARAALSALGVAIGIATMVAMLGIAASGQADLLRRLDALGTGLLRVQPGESIGGGEPRLPERAVALTARVDGVASASATGELDATVRRTDRIPRVETGGLTVQAADLGLLRTLRGGVRAGAWLNDATARHPAVVLGAVAADRLGITGPGVRVHVGDRWFTVVGVLAPLPLAPEIDRAALVGVPAARAHLGYDGRPTTVYGQAPDTAVPAVRALLPRALNPERPSDVAVSRPSDALAARAAAAGTLDGLLLGLGAVALLVGGVGIANTMVVSVLERRREIGLRRALGATRGLVRAQFLTESLLLSTLGGVAGLLLGALATAGYALARGWPFALPLPALAGALGATLLVGALAGLYPAVRAARLAPTEALAAS